MAPENRVTTANVFVETLNALLKIVTTVNIFIETLNIPTKIVTTTNVFVETQTITDDAQHVTSIVLFVEWQYPPSKYTVQMI